MMLAVVAVLFFVSTWWMRCYTNHGESVQVDDFTGMKLADAKKKGEDKDFRFEIMDSVWREGMPSGIIILQDPKPLSRVKEGRKIYVNVTGDPKPEILPQFSVSSYDFEQYKSKLEKRGIKVKEKEKVFDAKQAENTILYFYHDGRKVTEAQVKSGYQVMPGDLLEFVVTERRSNLVEIPDLVCMDFSTAEFLVSTFNLNIGMVNDDGTVTDQNSAYVYRQEPAYSPSQMVQMGGQITVWLTQDLPPGCSSGDEE
jgi:D-alanine-D-alanine ligase